MSDVVDANLEDDLVPFSRFHKARRDRGKLSDCSYVSVVHLTHKGTLPSGRNLYMLHSFPARPDHLTRRSSFYIQVTSEHNIYP